MEPSVKSGVFWAGAGAFSGVLLLWQLTYSYSCLALIWATIVFAAIYTGQFRFALHERRFRADYYFRPESWMNRCARGRIVAAFLSFLTAVPTTLLILGFAATARGSDWGFLVGEAVLVTGLFLFIRRPVEKHLAPGVAPIVGKRFAVIASFILLTLLYVPVSYYFVSVPEYLVGSSLELSISNASRQIASVCPVINWALKSMQELQATIWFEMLFGTRAIQGVSISTIPVWGVFFLNSALVFLACGRGTLEFATLGSKPNHPIDFHVSA